MVKEKKKIALKGQVYATPRTESVEIMNQGAVLAGSPAGAKGFGLSNYSSGKTGEI